MKKFFKLYCLKKKMWMVTWRRKKSNCEKENGKFVEEANSTKKTKKNLTCETAERPPGLHPSETPCVRRGWWGDDKGAGGKKEGVAG